MQSRSPKITIKVGGKRPEITLPPVHTRKETLEKEPLEVSSSEYSSDDEETTPLCDYSQKQMVIYNPSLNGSDAIQPVKKPDPKPRSGSKGVPEVGAFTVQCANCLKWRLIPDQEKYEVIREHITDEPFICETTRQWDRVVSCDDPTDIEQDGTRIWAIDKPNIAQPPPGWKRLLRLRSEGSSKFADVYYTSPTGTKLRSLPDVVKYLEKNPIHAQGIGLGRFSFQIPKPLQENYVRKRPSQMAAPVTPEYLEPKPAEPLRWAVPEENLNVQIAQPLSWVGPIDSRNLKSPYIKTPKIDPENQAAKKAKRYKYDCS